MFLALLLLFVVSVAAVVSDYEYRLADGPSHLRGRLELRRRGDEAWSTVCNTTVTTSTARVAAQSLGYTLVRIDTTTPNRPLASASQPVVGSPSCSSSAKQISMCTFRTVPTICRAHAYDLWIEVAPGTQRSLRFVAGGTAGIGQLETYYSGRWRRLCGSRASSSEAVAACRQLGFNVDAARMLYSSESPSPRSSLTLSTSLSIICAPGMLSWANCSTTVTSSSSCSGSTTGLDCLANQWEYRLVDTSGAPVATTSGSAAGRLEVRPNANSAWGGVCDDSFGTVDADVACRSVVGSSFDGRAVYRTTGSGAYYRSSGSIYMDDLACVSSNSELGECTRSASHNCARSEDVLLGCFAGVPPTERHWEYRLAEGQRGLLEVRPSATSAWGTVCDDSFSAYDARIACLSVGVNASGAAFTRVSTSPAITPVWMDNMNCESNATARELGHCSFSFNTNDCMGHTEDIAVDCTAGLREMRIVGEPGRTAGQPQLRTNASAPWQPLCATTSLNTALAVCRTILGTTAVAASFTTLSRITPSNMADVILTTGTPVRISLTCPSSAASIAECSITPHAGSCTMAYFVCSVKPAADEINFSYRLVGGTERLGLLEVRPSHDAEWGTVCDDSFSGVDAVAACRSLGFATDVAGYSTSSATTYGRAGPVWMDNVGCSTASSDLGSCSHSFAGSDCSAHTEDIFLNCALDQYEYRLAGSSGPRTSGSYASETGAIQFRANASSPWESVCYSSFGSGDAAVACRSLGYGSNVERTYTYTAVGNTVVGHRMNCGGSEVALGACGSTSVSCGGRFASVTCSVRTYYLQAWEYRLAASTLPARGRLEVRPTAASSWGTVCDDSFGTVDAEAACRSLGYGDGAGGTYFRASGGSGPIWMDNMGCAATDTRLTNCSFSYNTNDCRTHTEDIGIDCRASSLEFRISGGPSASHGRLEVRTNTTAPWGSVCAAGFTLLSARTACGTLGLPSTAASFLPASDAGAAAPSAPTPGGPMLSGVSCSTSSTLLGQCSMTTARCSEAADAVILRCDATSAYPLSQRDWEYRLALTDTGPSVAGPLAKTEGLLQVRPNATAAWGTICDDAFSMQDARVLCTVLGYTLPTSRNPVFKSGLAPFRRYDSGPIWVDNLYCPAGAQSLTNCSYSFSGTDCLTHTEDVSLDCAVAAWDFRFVRPFGADNTSTQGRIEMRPNASAAWGTICGRHVTYTTAVTLCRDAGFTAAGLVPTWSAASATVGIPIAATTAPIWMAPQCTSNVYAASSSECQRWPTEACTHADDVVLNCASPPALANATWAYRIGSNGSNSGLLQVRPSPGSSWGAVCRDTTFARDAIASIVGCRAAGFPVNRSRSVPTASFSGPVWMRSVSCSSTAAGTLDNCSSFIYNSASSTCAAAVSLDCTNGGDWEFRLVDEFGTSNTVAGRLEVRPNATTLWGTVCDDGFSSVDAATACVSLGHSRLGLTIAAVVANTQFRLGTTTAAATPIYMDDLACTSTDNFLPYCPRRAVGHNCGHGEDVAIQCSSLPSTPEWQYRLAASTAAGSGRLEVRPGPMAAWGTVCDDGFGPEEAAAACRALGFGGTNARADYTVASGIGTIWLDDVTCPFGVTGFDGCSKRYNSHNCGHSEDVGVRCQAVSRDYRLFPEPQSTTRGRVMFRPNSSSAYGGVCDSTAFTTSDATALCRTLVPGSLVGVPLTNVGGDVSPMWISRMSCPNGASNANTCPITIDPHGTACSVPEGVGVDCATSAVVARWNATLTLATTTRSGFAVHRVLLTPPPSTRRQVATTSSQVCFNGFNRQAAAAMCRSAGYVGSALVQSLSLSSSFSVINARYNCPDSAQSIADCEILPNDAECANAAAVVCGIEWSTRVSGGSSGLLQVRPAPSQPWGTVCDDYFEKVDAWAACWSAGYSPLEVSIDLTGNGGSGPIWLDNVGCSEGQHLEDCAFSFDNHNCGHGEDVHVNCAVLPGWLIAIIVILSIAAFGLLVFAAWWVCTREERERQRREREFQDALDARAGPLDAAAQQALFDDDIPAELRPMADVEGLNLVDEARPAPKFDAPALPVDPDLTEFHKVQQAMVLAARGDNNAVVDLNLEYIRRSTRGFSHTDGVQTTRPALATFNAWDLAGGLVYPSTMVVATGSKCRDARTSAAACEGARYPNVATVLGSFVSRRGDSAAIAAAASISHGRFASVLALEAFPKHFGLGVQLGSLGGAALHPATAASLTHRIINGVESLLRHELHPVLSLDNIVTRDGTLHGEPVITVFSPPTGPSNAFIVTDLHVVLCAIASAAHQPSPPVCWEDPNTALTQLRPAGPRPGAPRTNTRKLTPYQFAEDVDCAVRLELECAMCGVMVHSSGYHLHGVDCSHEDQHFMCCECVNTRVSSLLTDDAVDMAELPCPMGCPGVWSFDDFGALVSPPLLRKWQQRSVERTRHQALEAAKEILDKAQQDAEADTSDPDMKEVREHVAAVRKMLRPACAYCGMAFESFSGCLSVTCGAKDRNGRQVSGCGQTFCGGCMTKKPCPKNCGHAFVQPGELHRLWRVWRMQRPTEYLREHFRGGSKDNHRSAAHSKEVLERVLRGIRSDLEVVGVWPLPGFDL